MFAPLVRIQIWPVSRPSASASIMAARCHHKWPVSIPCLRDFLSSPPFSIKMASLSSPGGPIFKNNYPTLKKINPNPPFCADLVSTWPHAHTVTSGHNWNNFISDLASANDLDLFHDLHVYHFLKMIWSEIWSRYFFKMIWSGKWSRSFLWSWSFIWYFWEKVMHKIKMIFK